MTDILNSLKEAQAKALELNKGYTQSASPVQGLTGYDLANPAKQVTPVLTPLRNLIARVADGFGNAHNYKLITNINVSNQGLGIPEASRGSVIDHDVVDKSAYYKTLGQDDFITWEAIEAAKNFDDIKAIRARNHLMSVMVQEEKLDYAGNGSLALGKAATPTVATAATGGSLPESTTYKVGVVALSLTGYEQLAGSNNGAIGSDVVLTGLVSRVTVTPTSSDSFVRNLGVGQKSDLATQATAAGTATNVITASVTAVPGAAGYAWFFGPSGSEKLVAVTTINSVIIKALPATGNTTYASLVDADCSVDSRVYDGLFTQCFLGNGSYVKQMDNGTAGVGTELTSDGSAGIVEINDAFEYFWNKLKCSPKYIVLTAKMHKQITSKIINGGGYRSNVQNGGAFVVQGGGRITNILNPITGDEVQFIIHPNAVKGTLLFLFTEVPSLTNVTNLIEKKLRYDYRQVEYVMTKRQYDYGIYFDGTLIHYLPQASGVIFNIKE